MKNESYETIRIGIRDTADAPKGKDIFYRCRICQSLIASLPRDNISCSCGNIGIDKDLNRLFVEDYTNFAVLKKVSSF